MHLAKLLLNNGQPERSSSPVPGQFPDSLDHYLSHSEGAGKLMAHVHLLQKLSRIYRDALPDHLGSASRVANYKSGTVVIHADNGAVAVKLRQLAPTLTREFYSRGIECTGVTVKVQALEIAGQTYNTTARTLPAEAGRRLDQLAHDMPPSPLRDAIEQLLERALREE
jgi:hypothetical protein